MASLSHHAAPLHQLNTDTCASSGSLGPAEDVSDVFSMEEPINCNRAMQNI